MKSRCPPKKAAESGFVGCWLKVHRLGSESLGDVKLSALAATLAGHPEEAGPCSSPANVWSSTPSTDHASAPGKKTDYWVRARLGPVNNHAVTRLRCSVMEWQWGESVDVSPVQSHSAARIWVMLNIWTPLGSTHVTPPGGAQSDVTSVWLSILSRSVPPTDLSIRAASSAAFRWCWN